MIGNELFRWCQMAMLEIQKKEYETNYCHTLYKTDPSPLIMHSHTAQMTVVMEGRGVGEINGKTRRMSRGDVLFIHPGETHRFRSESEKMILFHIHVPYETQNSDRNILEGTDFEVHL